MKYITGKNEKNILKVIRKIITNTNSKAGKYIKTYSNELDLYVTYEHSLNSSYEFIISTYEAHAVGRSVSFKLKIINENSMINDALFSLYFKDEAHLVDFLMKNLNPMSILLYNIIYSYEIINELSLESIDYNILIKESFQNDDEII